MTEKWTKDELKKTASIIDRRSSANLKFRKKTIRFPAEAIQEITGKKVPAGKCLRIIEHNPGFDLLYRWQSQVKDEKVEALLDRVASAIKHSNSNKK